MRDNSLRSRNPPRPAVRPERNILLCAGLLLVFIMSCATRIRGQEASAQKVLHNAEIVSLTKAGLSDAAIISVIRKSRTDFDLSPEALVSLRQAGVSNAVIEAMLGPPTAGPLATAPSQALLPVAFGYYVVEANEIRSLPVVKVATRVGLAIQGEAAGLVGRGAGFAVDGLEGEAPLTIRTATPVFIVYQQNIDVNALLLSELVYISSMKAYQFNIAETGPLVFPSLYGLDPDDTITVDVWRPNTDVPLRIEPVEARPAMYRLIPSSPLKPGRYALYGGEALHHEGIILGTAAISPSVAVYFGVDITLSHSARDSQPSAPAPSCSDDNSCPNSVNGALRPSQWDLWDKTLRLGGTLSFDVMHRKGLSSAEKGTLLLSVSEISFLGPAQEKVFSVAPHDISFHGQGSGSAVSPASLLGLRIGSKNYRFYPVPVGFVCKKIICEEPGLSEQTAVAKYIDETISKLQSGAFKKDDTLNQHSPPPPVREGAQSASLELKEGQTPEEVELILGKPEDVIAVKDTVIYVYPTVKAFFENGKLVNVEERKR